MRTRYILAVAAVSIPLLAGCTSASLTSAPKPSTPRATTATIEPSASESPQLALANQDEGACDAYVGKDLDGPMPDELRAVVQDAQAHSSGGVDLAQLATADADATRYETSAEPELASLLAAYDRPVHEIETIATGSGSGQFHTIDASGYIAISQYCVKNVYAVLYP